MPCNFTFCIFMSSCYFTSGNFSPAISGRAISRPSFLALQWQLVTLGIIAKFHYTDTDTDFFAAKLRWVRAGPCPCPCRARIRVRVVEFSYYLGSLSATTSWKTPMHAASLPCAISAAVGMMRSSTANDFIATLYSPFYIHNRHRHTQAT